MELQYLEDYLKVGDIVVMEAASGWGFSQYNDGCLAEVTSIGREKYRAMSMDCQTISGFLLNPKDGWPPSRFVNIPVYKRPLGEHHPWKSGKWTARLATQEEIDEYMNSISFEDNEIMEI